MTIVSVIRTMRVEYNRQIKDSNDECERVQNCQLDTHLSTAYAVFMYVLYLLLKKKGPTLVGLTISKYKEQIVIYNNALSVHYTSVIS